MKNAWLLAACVLPLLAGCSVHGDVTPACPTPLANWYHAGVGRFTYGEMTPNRIEPAGPAILWNGKEINEVDLKEYLALVALMRPAPGTIYDPSKATDCAGATRIRDIIDATPACKEGGCWQGTAAAFEAADPKDGMQDPIW